jgi:hypothetical protein
MKTVFESYFDELRVQIADASFGPEPALSEIILRYYLLGFDEDEAERLTQEYIRQWSNAVRDEMLP